MLSPFAAQEHLMCPIALKHMTDSVLLRGILLAIHFGLVVLPDRWNVTRKCKGAVSLMEYNANDKPSGLQYRWRCSMCRHRIGVKGLGPLANIRVHDWLAFLYFVSSLQCDIRWTVMLAELRRKFGLCAGHKQKWSAAWLKYVHAAMRRRLHAWGFLKMGGKQCTAAIDETTWSKGMGISKRPRRPKLLKRALAKARIAKQFPSRTTWTKEGHRLASVVKAKLAMKKRGPQKGNRVRWVWSAVLTGLAGQRCTHGNGKKQVILSLLPQTHATWQGKPRGDVELKKRISQHLKRGTKHVTYQWPGTLAAVKKLRRSQAHATVNHSEEWRNSQGYRANNVESEHSRLQAWVRARHGKYLSSNMMVSCNNICLAQRRPEF